MGDALLAPMRGRCRLSITIPAKDEERSIPRALAASCDQRALDGAPLDPDLFEVLVFANDCSDGTAEAVRAFAMANPRHAIHVLSQSMPGHCAHVGGARRMALDVAYTRQHRIHGDDGVIATTDADSTVDPFWVARTLREIANVDAVAGHVEISVGERDAMDEPLRKLYERECLYRRLSGELEDLYDPRPFDPPLRHNAFVGTSFAVRTGTYETAGRLPILSQREDVAFALALRRVDARIRHSYDVRVETSARSDARVAGGFGTYLDYLRDRSTHGEMHVVDSGMRSVLRAKTRGLLRSYWARPAVHLLEPVARMCQSTARDIASLVDPSSPFGETLDRIEAAGIPFEALPEEPIEDAIAIIRDAVLAATYDSMRARGTSAVHVQ